MFNKFLSFLNKDSTDENESNRAVVTIRVIYLVMLLYCFLNTLLGLTIDGAYIKISLLLFFSTAIGVAFYMTYKLKNQYSLILFNFALISWVILSVIIYGWNTGVQHFLMVLLAIDFLSIQERLKQKITISVALILLRIVMYGIFSQRVGMYPADASHQDFLQILNCIIIYLSLAVVCYAFGNKNQKLEWKLMEYNNILKDQANTDQLTKLPNRRRAMEYLDELINNNYDNFSLCICDIDFFKKVNDTYGHEAGDKVLEDIAALMRNALRKDTFVARWGGEEFLIVFPYSSTEEATVPLERLRLRIGEMVSMIDKTAIKITMTFGVAEYDSNIGLTATLKLADDRLYAGKQAGRNIVISK